MPQDISKNQSYHMPECWEGSNASISIPTLMPPIMKAEY